MLAAIGPTARVAHLGSAALTVALAAVPVIVTLARSEDVSVPLILAGLCSGAALAWAVDDRAADLMGSLPVSSPVRTTLRVGLVACLAIVGAAVIAIAVAVGPGLPPDFGDRLAETAAAAAVSLGVSLVAARRGERGTGPVGVTAGVLAVGLVAALSVRWPTVLPALAPGSTHARWWVVAAGGFAVAAYAGRDPGRRTMSNGRLGRFVKGRSGIVVPSRDPPCFGPRVVQGAAPDPGRALHRVARSRESDLHLDGRST